MQRAVLAVIKKKNTEKFLLVKAKSDSNRRFRGRWMVPGGTITRKESPQKSLIREIKEELGILIKPLKLIEKTKGDEKNQVLEWWLVEPIKNKKILFSDEELDGFAYFTKKEMKKLPLWPATKKFFKKHPEI